MNPYLNRRVLVTFLATAFCLLPQFSGTARAQAASPDRLWQSIDKIPAAPANARIGIRPTKFKTFTLDAAVLRATLSQAPMEFTGRPPQDAGLEITLPKPDGSFARFLIEEVALMEPRLAAKFPGIKTYRGRGLDDPMATLSLDVNPQTFHAQVLSPSGAYYVDPYWQHDGSAYMSYAKSDLSAGDRQFKCLFENESRQQAQLAATAPAAPNNANSGKNLRTYRLACATSLRYSQYHGGTSPDVALVLAALVTMNNRVSKVYEDELGVRMVLVNDQDQIIATATNPTPYSDTPGDIGSNPAYIDQRIGPENYDIGHVVTVGSGGVAGLGVVCRGFNPTSGGSAKARGTTGIDPPENDAFWIDFVAHEMGHQFGGNHTFDGTGTNCGTNQNAGTAYEPGSGTTIQAYAGICSDQNIQANSDPVFHFASLVEMFGYITSGISTRPPGILLPRAASTPPPAAPDATPSAGTLNPNPGETLTWRGTAVGGAALDDETCEEGVTCDTFNLTLSGQASDWHEKTVKITFNWPNATDDYDFYVRKDSPTGPIVDESAGGDRPEIVELVPEATGVGTGLFAVRGVYFSVVPLVLPELYQYTAEAVVTDQSNPGAAPTCAVVTDTGNNPPTVNAGADYKIPARTPFVLTAAGSDPDGDPLTYCWEEADLGPNPKDANLPDDGVNPIFRSFLPKPNPTRTLVRWQELLVNLTQTRGEKLPTTTRDLNFRVTARDNIFGGHGFDDMKINVLDSGAGFAVTSPNTAVTLPGGGNHVVTWNVANTTGADINTANVNILLSINAVIGPDGEDPTFPIVLAANTPNDGTEAVTIPNIGTAKARVMVQAVGNIYFDISDVDFTITGPAPSPTPTPSPGATPTPTPTPTPSATPGATPSATPTPTPSATPSASPAQLLNISSRARVQTGDNILIGGFIVTGNQPKQVLMRAIGPSLQVGGNPVPGRMADPTLQLRDSNGLTVRTNDNWKDSSDRAAIEATGLAPSDDRESAIIRTLNPGAYTAILRGVNDTTGIALVEVYDRSSANSLLANISSRSFVETADNVLIGGFIAGNQPGSTDILVRALGPSIKNQLPNALDDPTLELRNSNGALLASNNNWKDAPERAQIEATGIPPSHDLESAIFRTLAPTQYTAIVRGNNGGIGVGVVEIYNTR
jgi:hypothetical protein